MQLRETTASANMSRSLIIIVTPAPSPLQIILLLIIIQCNSIFYYLCAESTANNSIQFNSIQFINMLT
jgi:hypothetical protein